MRQMSIKTTSRHCRMATFIGRVITGCITCQYVEWCFNQKVYGECLKHNVTTTPAPKVKHHTGNGAPKGKFAGTLTMGHDTPESEETMVVAIKKIFNQQTCIVKECKWYVELTKAGLPHVHFMYETVSGGRIHAKIFMRYWKLWNEGIRHGNGFQGGYHKPVKSDIAYDEYIAKDNGRSGGFKLDYEPENTIHYLDE